MPAAKAERTEADVLGNLKDYAKRRRLKMIRLSMRPGVETGWPDTEWFLPPGHLFNSAPFLLEVKKPGEVPEPKQLHIMAELRFLGYDVDWCDNSAKGIELIEYRLMLRGYNETDELPAFAGAAAVSGDHR